MTRLGWCLGWLIHPRVVACHDRCHEHRHCRQDWVTAALLTPRAVCGLVGCGCDASRCLWQPQWGSWLLRLGVEWHFHRGDCCADGHALGFAAKMLLGRWQQRGHHQRDWAGGTQTAATRPPSSAATGAQAALARQPHEAVRRVRLSTAKGGAGAQCSRTRQSLSAARRLPLHGCSRQGD